MTMGFLGLRSMQQWTLTVPPRRAARPGVRSTSRLCFPRTTPRPFPPLAAGRTADACSIPARLTPVNGESEAGKSFVSQHVAVQEIERGHGVVYLDFEDEVGSVTAHLVELGCPPASILAHFAYISPHEPLTTERARADLQAAMGDLRPSLVILDGVTEALSLHGFATVDNDEVAKFGRLLTRPLTDTGAAVLSLDHVTKDRESRGRYAIGGVHKLNGLSGAAFTLESVHRFGVGMAGKSRLYIAKDRPGQLRPHALPTSGNRHWYADFISKPRARHRLSCWRRSSGPSHTSRPSSWRKSPTRCSARASPS